jgi:hypothetical protein
MDTSPLEQLAVTNLVKFLAIYRNPNLITGGISARQSERHLPCKTCRCETNYDVTFTFGGPGSVVGIATAYGLGGAEI